MLDRAQRLVHREEFEAAVRGGRRAGASALVIHLRASSAPPGATSRAGLVVGRTVGNAVRRNRVKRRLRHLLRTRLDQLPPGSSVVVRALPAAADATSERLAADLDRALARALRSSRRP